MNNTINYNYIVSFLTINSILIDVSFNMVLINLFYWNINLLSNLNYSTLHFSILIWIIFILGLFFLIYIFIISFVVFGLIDFGSVFILVIFLVLFYWYFIFSFNSNCTFFISIFMDVLIIYSSFFFINITNSIEVFIGLNLCYSLLISQYISFFTFSFFIMVLFLVL